MIAWLYTYTSVYTCSSNMTWWYYSTHRSGRVSCSVRSGATMWTSPPTALLPPPSFLCLHLAYNTIVYHLQIHAIKLNLNTCMDTYMYIQCNLQMNSTEVLNHQRVSLTRVHKSLKVHELLKGILIYGQAESSTIKSVWNVAAVPSKDVMGKQMTP